MPPPYNSSVHGQLTNEVQNGGEVRGFGYDYAYDPIGNRTSATYYDEQGEAVASAYTANALNQYTSRTVPGNVQVRGEADTDAVVTVNENPTWRNVTVTGTIGWRKFLEAIDKIMAKNTIQIVTTWAVADVQSRNMKCSILRKPARLAPNSIPG